MHGLASSLVNLVVAAVYSLLVVRLSLDYLGKQEYGLLSLLAQISAYIAILDLGLTIAFGRILIDYTRDSSELYARALRTASLVFTLLGFLGFVIAAFIALFGKSSLSIPSSLNKEFTNLMLLQGGILFATFWLKSVSAPLIANGKHYVIYWVSSATFILNAGIFWISLHYGFGIYSSAFGQAIALLLNAALLWRLSSPYRVAATVKTSFDRKIFREVFAFTKDTMIWQIGGQTMASLPILLAASWFALGATADLSAGLKLVLLAVAVCTRFGDMSVTPLSIEYAHGNKDVAVRQMTRITRIAGGIGVCAAIFTTCANPSFLNWWMLGKIAWPWHANLTAALWIAILTITQCLYGFAVISRQLKLIRWALLAECGLYVSVSAVASRGGNPSALLWIKPVATLCVGIYVALRIRKYTSFDTLLLLPDIFRQTLVMVVFLPTGIITSIHISTATASPILAFLLNFGFASILTVIALPFVFTGETRLDILQTLYRTMKKICGIFKITSTNHETS